jgi:large subunit ribosomal protein L18
MQSTVIQKERRRTRVRAKVMGTPERPRLTVHVTNKHVTAQLVDDTTGKTLGYATTVKSAVKGTMTEKAAAIGKSIATAGKKAKVTTVVFDRAGRLYHGRLSALADAARAEGLEF